MFGACKHQHLMPVIFLDKMGEQLTLSFAIHRVNFLRDQFCSSVAARHFYHRRFVEQPIGQHLDLVGEGGGKQQVLPLPGQYSQDFFDVTNEAHVQHAVGFIQHQNFYMRQIQRLLLQVIKQPARCGNQNIHTTF